MKALRAKAALDALSRTKLVESVQPCRAIQNRDCQVQYSSEYISTSERLIKEEMTLLFPHVLTIDPTVVMTQRKIPGVGTQL